ncbi:uncharacterized protein AKAME5_002100300 [Lates japonicus]|uniref:Uncharacterized protein n=1 Tax=Lates japonicus TaxID=270547 RepID=A0AAD3NAT2_LATJO|nr:uncharacterized protein AKAME5_002100300 [Lates japonicus]
MKTCWYSHTSPVQLSGLILLAFVSSIPPLNALGPLWPLAPAGLYILHPSTMRSLLESSWMKFGPAGRDSLDWSSGPSALPSTDRQAPGQSSGEAIITAKSIAYIAIATVSVLLLFLTILSFLIWRRRRGFHLDGKLGLANVIALEDLQDPERNCELLSSLRRSRGQHQLPSSSSEQDVTDGVFLMVYLPSPYEQTLTRIARAASTSSSKDMELLPPSPGPETSSRSEEEEGMRLNDKAIIEEEIRD